MKCRLLLIAMTVACCSSSCTDEPTTRAADTGRGAQHVSHPSNEAIRSETETDGMQLGDVMNNALRERGHYRRPESSEIERARRLFNATLEIAADFDDLRTRWKAEGMELLQVNDSKERFWVLREAEGERFGRGITVFRRSESAPVMLQAPHSFFDLDTDEIALGLFLSGRCRVCFWNSVHRRVADLADEEMSFLNALTAAFAQSFPHGRTVQLHGFYDDRRHPRFDRPFALIISQGTDNPTSGFLMLAQAVRRECVPFETAVYPVDIRELGGTLNRQREVLLEEGNENFVHLEMSPGFRSAVLDDRDVAGRLGRVLSNLELNPLIN
jgi:hypothetical protein